jgi:hypothetical protein
MTNGVSAAPLGTRIFIDSALGFKESRKFGCALDGRFDTGHIFSRGQFLELAAIAPGFSEVRRELNLDEIDGNTAQIDVVLVLDQQERFAHGRVINEQGAGVAGASLFLKPLVIGSAGGSTSGHEPVTQLETSILHAQPDESLASQWRSAGRTNTLGEFCVRGMDSRKAYSALIISNNYANARLWIREGVPTSNIDLGTVTLRIGARLHGVVRTRDGDPVTGLPIHTVWIRRAEVVGARQGFRLPASFTGAFDAVTNGSGQFSIEPLPEGECKLLVGGTLFGPYELRSGETLGPQVIEVDQDPRDREHEDNSVCVCVTHRDGTPVGGAWIQAFRQLSDDVESRRPKYELLAAVPVNERGQSRLPTLPSGVLNLRVIDIDGGCEETTITLDTASTSPVIDIILMPKVPPDRVVHGTVSDQWGWPLRGQKVTLQIAPSVTGCTCVSRVTYTDAMGTFTIGPIIAGTHRLVTTDPEGRFAPLERFPVTAGDEVALTMTD